MRIRTTTGPGASPPPGLNKNSNDQANLRRIGADALGMSPADRSAGMQPLRPVVPIMTIIPVACGGDQR
jgi:hypothetical protein